MVELILLNGSNWQEFFNKKITYVMFSKSDCNQCEILEKRLYNLIPIQEIAFCKLNLDTPGFAKLKQDYPWISRIDTLPFNTIFSEGRLIDSWSGSDLENIVSNLKQLSD